MANNEMAMEALNLLKAGFKLWTGETIELAKKIIQLEERILAVQSDKPTEKKEDIPDYRDEQPKISNAPKINTIPTRQPIAPPVDDDSDLPFTLFIPLLAASLLQYLI